MHRKMALRRAWIGLGGGVCLALTLGCHDKSASPHPTAATATEASASPEASARPTATADTPRDDHTTRIPAWAVGAWTARATLHRTELKLPNDQGVQIAWLKDKGVQHSGEVELSLTLTAPGVATGQLSGALGTLSLSGVWPEQGPLHLELQPTHDGAEVFHGTLTLTWDAEKQRARGILRATSGDGHWLRSAELEVVRAS